MAKINLLPWRQELRKEQQRQFFTILGLSLVLVVVGILAVHLQYARLIGKQEDRNAFLTQHIRKVEAEIKEIDALAEKKDRLLARMEIIQKLQRNRPEMVRLFDELVRVLPEGVHLSKLKQTGRTLNMDGIAQSNARVSAFMRNIDESDWLADPKLQIIEVGKKESTRKFSLHAKQSTKGAAENGDAASKQNNAGKK